MNKLNENNMRVLLNDIELDIQEIKLLVDVLSREPNAMLREVLKRNILQARDRLDRMLQELNAVQDIPKDQIRSSQTIEDVSENSEEKNGMENLQVATSSCHDMVDTEPERDSVVITPILGERIRPVNDLRCSISLNDSFRFSRELFGGDNELMNRVISQISEMSSLDAAIAFLLSKVNVGEENEALLDFQELLKKYFI